MKKNITRGFSRSSLFNISLKMKLTSLLLIISLFEMHASVYSQNTKISLKIKNTTLEQVFSEIESKTEFKFLFKNKEIELNKKVSIDVTRKNINQILNQLFKGTSTEFKVYENRQIILSNQQVVKEVDHENIEIEKVIKQGQISGKVTDNSGMPMVGVNVNLLGSKKGTTTDFEGNFVLMVEKGDVLEFSYLGMKTKMITVQNESQLKVVMEEEASTLNDVVVVGFSTQKRANISGSVSTVKMSEVLGDRPITSTSSAIQGAVSGLQVTSGTGRPGEGMALQVRGFQSINGGSPLVLVNNVPMSIDNINPADIETVTVLKDAAAASIYGARAAFGVILITTKTGKKSQEIAVNFSSSTSFDYPTELPKKASVYDFVTALNRWGTTGYWTNQDIPTWKTTLDDYKLNPGNYPDGIATINNVIYPLVGNDEAGKDFYSDLGTTTIHNLSISGGSEKSIFRMSAGYTKQDGIIVTENDSFRKFTVNTDYKTNITDKLSVDLNLNYLNSLTKDPLGDYYRYITFSPYAPTGFQTQADGSMIPYNTPGNQERFGIAPETQRDNLRFFSKIEYKPMRALTFVGEYTYGYSTSEFKSVNNQATFIDAQRYSLLPGDPAKTRLDLSNSRTRYNGTNLYAKLKHKFSNHNFELLGGFNNEMSHGSSLSAGVTSLIDASLPAIDLATGPEYGNDSYSDWSVMGFFGRFTYNFSERYFIEINGRKDGSSRFPKDERWGFFPSASAAWNITQESFMENIKAISLLKLRASLGEIGNQNTPTLYDFYAGLSGIQSAWIDPSTGIKYTSLSTPPIVRNDFTWETVRTLNYGIDLSLFNNRLSSSFDLFKRQTIDMLGPGASLPTVLGAAPPFQNAADLEVNGWELEMKWQSKIKAVSYYAGFNLTDNQAKITKFNNEAGLISDYYVGQNIGEIYGNVTDGYYTVDDFVAGTLNSNLQNGTLNPGVVKVQGVNPNPGDIKYKDLNGDGIINNGNNTLYTQFDPNTGEMIANTGLGDRKVIGNSTRRYQYGVNAGASYKGFDLSLFVQGIGKRDVWISNDVVFPYVSEFSTMFAHQLDYWTPENTNAYFPRNYPLGGVNYGYSRRVQTKYLADGSYIRLKNITLGYSLPKSVLQNLAVKNVKLYFSGENLFNFDHLPDGLNTELSNLGNGGNYPFLKQYSLGVNVSF